MNKKTKDLYLAAAFLTCGAKLVSIDRTDVRHQEFTFALKEDSVALQEKDDASAKLVTTRKVDLDLVETQWANAELMLNAVRYKDALQRMKTLIHSR